jgi:signal transduction histidine kinase
MAACALPAAARVVAPLAVAVQASPVDTPAALAKDWVPVWPAPAGSPPTSGPAWFRVSFDLPAADTGAGSLALYLPYLYRGGRLWLNGAPLATLAQRSAQLHVNWTRPHLLPVPDALWHPGRNELILQASAGDFGAGERLQQIAIGPREELLPRHDRRLFWVHTLPQSAVVVCIVTGLFVGFVWWRRHSEALYGLFGLAALLWGVRTMTFVIEVMPAAWWPWWRTAYHAATGGFIIVLATFAMRFAGIHRPWVDRLLFGYWLIGPLAMIASRGALDDAVGLYWAGGLIPVGLSIIGFTALAAWRQRGGASMVLFAAVLLATTAGIHDYLLTYPNLIRLPDALAGWTAQRIYLLHVGADLVLLAMMAILTQRFVNSLDSIEHLNRGLEARVAARERELQLRHAELSRLTHESAVAGERQRIMQDLHDGLGSQLFVALSHVERGAIDTAGVGRLLRDCIADMRLTFEVIVPDADGPHAVLGSFRFRWDSLLREAGIAAAWTIEVAPDAVALPPAVAQQILRVAQEALTNVLKHAGASQVQVVLDQQVTAFEMSVTDNGRGGADATPGGRGVANMRRRAAALGGTLQLESRPGHTCVALRVPLAQHG